MSVTINVEHEGRAYTGTVMRITSTMLGDEDYGIFTAYLMCDGRGTGVGLGGYGLDAWSEDDKRRVGTAYGLDHIKEILRTVGVSRWEKLTGVDVIVLHEGSSILGTVAAGFADITGERVLIFKDHAEAWKSREDLS